MVVRNVICYGYGGRSKKLREYVFKYKSKVEVLVVFCIVSGVNKSGYWENEERIDI